MKKKIFAGIFLNTDTGRLEDGQGNPLRARPNAKKRRWPTVSDRSQTFHEAETAPKPEHYDRKFPHAKYQIDPDTYWQDGKLYKRDKKG